MPHIRKALIDDDARGVALKVIVETPNKLESENEHDTLRALGEEVAAHATVYYWPLEERLAESASRPGILHVKCIVADGRWLFLSSANLTEYAFTSNMELGVLITGGSHPQQVDRCFESLVEHGVLKRLQLTGD